MNENPLSSDDFIEESMSEDDISMFFDTYHDDPVAFAQDICQLDVDPPQIEILRAVKNHQYCGVSSGHGIGKSTMTAVLILWWMSTRPDCRVVVTSNTATQLRTRTWASVAEVLNKCLVKSWFEYTATTLKKKHCEDTWFTICNTWSDNNFESFQGIHADSVLMLFDEASSIPAGLFEVAEGALTTRDCKAVMFGNPTRTTGYFYDKLNNETKWFPLEIDSRQSRWTNKQKLQDWADEHGEDSDFFRVRVRGKFPKQTSSTLINPYTVDAAVGQGTTNVNHVKVLGIDVARENDSMVLTVRVGDHIAEIIEYRGDPDNIDSTVTALDRKYSLDYIAYDSTGHGSWFGSQFKNIGLKAQLIGICFSESSNDPRYSNKRTEMYGKLNDYFKLNGKILDNKFLIEDLKAQEYYYDTRNRFALLKKDIIKKELGRSPDFGDSFALTMMIPTNMFILNKAEEQFNNELFAYKFRQISKNMRYKND
jgi:hypothetical protein